MSTKTSKVYTIMKDGIKIKTTKSLNTAKAIADQEQADVFCGDECVYKSVTSGLDGADKPYNSQSAEATEAVKAVKAVETVQAVQASEAQSDVSDKVDNADNAAKEEAAPKTDSTAEEPTVKEATAEASVSVSNDSASNVSGISDISDMAEKPTAASKPMTSIKKYKKDKGHLVGVAIAPHTPQPKYGNYRLTALMNVRAKPSLSAPVLRTAPAGTVVQVCQIEDNGENINNKWMKIRNGSNFAYILYEKGEKDGKKFAEKVGA